MPVVKTHRSEVTESLLIEHSQLEQDVDCWVVTSDAPSDECVTLAVWKNVTGIATASYCFLGERAKSEALIKPSVRGKKEMYAFTCGAAWLAEQRRRNMAKGRKSLARAQLAGVAFGLLGSMISLLGMPVLGCHLLTQLARGKVFTRRTDGGYREDLVIRRLLALQNDAKHYIQKTHDKPDYNRTNTLEWAEAAICALDFLTKILLSIMTRVFVFQRLYLMR